MKKKTSMLLALSTLVLTARSGESAPQAIAVPQTESAAADTESSDRMEVVGGGQVEIADSYTWTVVMNVAETTLNYKMMDKFKELIKAKSDGKIMLNLYTSGQLGNDTEQVQDMIEGSNDSVTTITSGLIFFVPAYGVSDLSNAFPGLETIRKMLDDENFVGTLNRDPATTNVRMMGMVDASFRQTTSDKETYSVADFSDLKVHVIQNPYYIAYWQSLDVNALAMDFSEVYVGLQQKTISAQESPCMNIVSNKFYKTQDYVTETNHLGHIIVFLANDELYTSLPENVQTLVDDCAHEAIVYTGGLADDSITADKVTIEESDAKIIALGSSVQAETKEKSAGVYDRIRETMKDELVDFLLNAIDVARQLEWRKQSMYFLTLKGGEIHDSLAKERREGGLGIRDGRIALVESLAEEETDVIDVGGCTVVPGFIDYHIHFYIGCDGGVTPDTISLPSGVTTAVDGGTCGVNTFEMSKRNNIDPSITRVLSYLHVSSSEPSTAVFPENTDPDCFERKKITTLFRKYPYIPRVLKIRMSRDIVELVGLMRESSEKAIRIAEEAGCPVMVHVSDSVIPQEGIAAMLCLGGVFCYMYQGMEDTIIDSRGHMKPEIWRVRERGVVFDASNGRGNFSFQVARPAVGEEFLPDIISSDISPVMSYKQPVISLPRLMSRYLIFGLPSEQVTDMVTINPARQLGDEKLGTLRDRSIADVAIIRVVEKPMQFHDLSHNFISGDRLPAPQMTIKGGKIVYCSPGFN